MVAPPLKTKKRRIVQRVSTLNRKAKNNRQGGREAEKFSNPSRTRGGVLRGARFARLLSNGVAAAAAAVASTCLFALWLLLRLGVACRAAHRRSALHGTGRTPLSHRLAALVTALRLLSRTIAITGAAAAVGSPLRLFFSCSLPFHGLGWAGQAGLPGLEPHLDRRRFFPSAAAPGEEEETERRRHDAGGTRVFFSL
ncbi:hypothetical protein VFPFJ_09989 [Purpureocillium lilacinum]|uniref:Transmembrane protein n=1 Tax=Purpureocillium lilacinum TaxID=33203 RepID=A0A179GQA3_PURLI|nr:hypothetical protein VFPFJ_09989 [Purpureocillium lilacinum]OAQ79503.1 hypothetical protein VFPFJ_09989 [Purpureocillium lilacinum]